MNTEENKAQELFAVPEQRSLWQDAMEQLFRNRLAIFGVLVALLLLFISIFGPWLAPYDYAEGNFMRIDEPPSRDHWLGTDGLGRDMFTRILYGARTAFLVGLIVTIGTTVLGVVLGAAGAFLGGWVDFIVMRLADITMAFPDILLAAFISVVFREKVLELQIHMQEEYGWSLSESNRVYLDYLVIFGALTLVQWYGKARLVRGQILSLREKEFIEAERALGASNWTIILSHLVPNSLGPLIVSITVGFGGAMLSEASLSFLGVGIQPPGASWGAMINDNLGQWRFKPHLVVMPGIVLAIVVLGFNFLGDGLNDALNPEQRRR
ncbi:MAG: ABC transporter permease [Caldilineaceae bacterium]|nr:ABC transporter permease [Caldilineaceae bacterium]